MAQATFSALGETMDVPSQQKANRPEVTTLLAGAWALRQRKCCVPLIALCSLTVRPLHISLEVHWERRFVSTEPVTQQTLNRPAERIAGFHSFVRSFENGYQVLGAKVKMYSVVPWASGRSRTSGYAGSGRRLFGREGAGGAGNVSAEAV